MKHYYETAPYLFLRHLAFKYWLIPRAYRLMSHYRIMDSWESIRYIIDNKCSVSRFGDGEFGVMMGKGNGFQQPDTKLAERLKEVISADDAPSCKICIPLSMKDTSYLVDGYPTFFWRHFMGRNVDFLRKFLKKDYVYLSTQFTRFYVERADKTRCAEHLALIRQIWENRDVLLVEGVQTRSGVGNDLYDNAKSVRRILGPAQNAFDKYEEALAAVRQYAKPDSLILLCYGMTATVLAYDLARLGYQAIDLGHVDIEYEWFRMGVMEREPIKGKYTNEASGGANPEPCSDPLYLSQIVCDITK